MMVVSSVRKLLPAVTENVRTFIKRVESTTPVAARPPVPRHELDSESRVQLKMLDKLPSIADIDQPIDYIRSAIELAAVKFKGDFDFSGTKQELDIPCSGYNLPVTVLRPKASHGDGVWRNIMVFFHGGGWVLGSRNTHMAFCEMLCQLCDCVIVNVEYRLAPEYKFPSCYEDGQRAVEWCLANKQLLSGNKLSLLGVAGDSAGGSIAATTCHLLPGIDYQILIYPVLTTNPTKIYDSLLNYMDRYLLTKELMIWFREHFFNSEDDIQNILASPLNRSNFSHLPPALLIVPECDPLTDQSVEYKEKLDRAGVPAELVLLEKVIHGFAESPGIFKRTTEKAVKSAAVFVSKL